MLERNHSSMCLAYLSPLILPFKWTDAIIEVVAFHDKVVATGFNADQTLPQMMCEEFYGCDKSLNVNKKPKKKPVGKKKYNSGVEL